MTSVFGPIKTGSGGEEAVITHLKNWMPAYLAEMERLTGRDAQTLPFPKSYTTTPRAPEKWIDSQLPAVLCVSTGLASAPKKEGSGSTRAIWRIGLATICSARNEEETHLFAKLYFAALRSAMVQHPSLGGFAEDTVWQGEDYDLTPSESRRSMASGYGLFDIEVTEVVNARMGLAEPPDDPYDVPDMPVVTATYLEVSKP